MEMIHYIFQIVPNSLNYDSSPGNVHKGYEMLGNVLLHFFKLYQIHRNMILVPGMYIKDMKY
jgi:hypothetical protein